MAETEASAGDTSQVEPHNLSVRGQQLPPTSLPPPLLPPKPPAPVPLDLTSPLSGNLTSFMKDLIYDDEFRGENLVPITSRNFCFVL